MATQMEKAFCELEIHSKKSVIALQQEFRKQFENDFKREFDQKVV
jgi:hypothetical protein